MEPDLSAAILNDPIVSGQKEQPTMTGTVTTPTTPPAAAETPDYSSAILSDPFIRATQGMGEPKPLEQGYTPDKGGGIFALGRLAANGMKDTTPQPGLNNSTAQEVRDMDQSFIKPQLPSNAVTGEPAQVVEPGSTVGVGVRTDVGASDDLSVKAAKLKAYYPFGDVRAVTYPDSSKALLVQATPGGPYARVSPSFQEKVDNFKHFAGYMFDPKQRNPLAVPDKTQTELAGKSAADLLLDVFADNPVDTAIGLLAAVLTPAEAGIAATGAINTAVGAAVNTAAKTTDVTRGYSNESPGSIATDSALTGALTGLFAAGGKTLSVMAGGLKQSVGEIPEAFRKIRQAAVELGLPDFMPQQVSPSEVVRRITARSEALNSMIGRYRARQEEAGSNAVRGLADNSYEQTFGMQLADSIQKWKDNVLKMLGNPNVSFEKAGTTIDTAISDTINSQKAAIRNLYDAAKNSGSPEYDITNVQNKAKDILTGVTQLSPPGSVPSSIINPATNLPMGNVATAPKPVRVSDTTELLGIIKDINELNPLVQNAQGVSRPIDALMELRRRLWDYTMPDPQTGLRRADAREAVQLRDAIDTALENPISGNPNTINLWRQANKAQRELYEVTETARIRQFLKAGDNELVTTPESMARTLLSSTGRNSENISRIFKVMQPAQRNVVRQAVTTELLREPDKILTKLEAYKKSPETWSQLIDPATVPKLEAIGKQFERLNTSGIEKIVASHDKAFNTISAMINNDPTVTSSLLHEFANQPGSVLGQDLRAGIIDYIFEKSRVITPEGEEMFTKLDATNLLKTMEGLGEHGKDMLRFLTPDDLRTINTVSNYLNLVQNRGKGEVAAAFSAGHAITEVMHMSAGAIHALTTAKLIGWAVTNGRAQKLLMGQPVSQAATPSAFLARFGAVLGAAADDARRKSTGTNADSPGVKKMADGGYVDRLNNNYKRNQKYLKDPKNNNYNTSLSPDEEKAFRDWVKQNKVPFNPDEPLQDYDMRGFYKSLQSGSGKATTGIDPYDGKMHYTDQFKTPYHETFSRESQYATPNAPYWKDDRYLMDENGNVLFDDAQGHADGGIVQTADASGSNTSSEAALQKRLDDFFKKKIKKIAPDSMAGTKGYVDIPPIKYPVGGMADGGLVTSDPVDVPGDGSYAVPLAIQGLANDYINSRAAGIQADLANGGEGLKDKIKGGFGADAGTVKIIKGVPGGELNHTLFGSAKNIKEFGVNVEGADVKQELRNPATYQNDIMPRPMGKLARKANSNNPLRTDDQKYNKAVAAQNVDKRQPEPIQDPVANKPSYNSVPFTKQTEFTPSAANTPDPEFLDRWRTSLMDTWDRSSNIPFNRAIDVVYLEMSGNTDALMRNYKSKEMLKKVQNSGELYDYLKHYVSSAYNLPLKEKPKKGFANGGIVQTRKYLQRGKK